MRGRLIILLLCAAVVVLGAAPAALAVGFDVTDIAPQVGGTGATVDCVVSGDFIHPLSHPGETPQFTLSDGLHSISGTTTRFDNLNGEWADVTFAIPTNATPGVYDLVARQHVGALYYADTLDSAFTVDLAPYIGDIDPPVLPLGSAARQIIVRGGNFISTPAPWARQSVVLVNGHVVPTIYYSSSTLGAVVPAFAMAYPGVAVIEVLNPGILPGGDRLSNAFSLPVFATPVITSINPTRAAPGGPAFTLEVNGTGFALGWGGAVVRWNNLDLATTRDASTRLRATVPASLIASAGTATITVRNGGNGAPVSNGVAFTVAQPTPVLGSISPTSVWAGYVRNDVVLTVNGSNFFSGAHIALNGVDKTATTFVGATQLTVPLAAADIATAGTINVSVKNPPFPPGTPSAGTLPLAVLAETTTPQVSIGGADTGWHNSPVLLSFAASDSQSGVQKVQYMAPPGVTTWTDGTSYTVPITSQGAITVSVQALDWCNKVGTATATVNIDATQPGTETLSDATVKKGHNARLKFRVSEPAGLSPKAKVTIKILRADGSQAKKLEYPSVPVNSDRVAGFECNLKKGTYKWYVYATDLAGNTQANVAKAKLTVH